MGTIDIFIAKVVSVLNDYILRIMSFVGYETCDWCGRYWRKRMLIDKKPFVYCPPCYFNRRKE